MNGQKQKFSELKKQAREAMAETSVAARREVAAQRRDGNEF